MLLPLVFLLLVFLLLVCLLFLFLPFLFLQRSFDGFEANESTKDETGKGESEDRNEGQCVTKQSKRRYVISRPKEVGREHWKKEMSRREGIREKRRRLRKQQRLRIMIKRKERS